MAVELLIRNQATGVLKLVPVATSEVFHNYWIPGCRALELQYVPRFEDGLGDFARSELSAVIQELRDLGLWFQDTQSPEDARGLVGRVDTVIAAFERVVNEPKLSIG
jgi:hypothetical protein